MMGDTIANSMTEVVKEPLIDGVTISIEIERVLVRRKTAYQEVIVADTPAYGRALFLDGLIQSSISDEALYHENLIHPALVIHGRPRRVLVAGTGEGASLREILRHPTIERVLSVDLDGEVVEICRRFLPEWSAGALDDPRVELRVQDVRETLKSVEPGSFDVVVGDLSDPVAEGPSAALWSCEYVAQVARVLADDGLFVLQAGEFDPCDLQMARAVRSTLLQVFPQVHFLHAAVPSFNCIWGFAIAAMRPLDLCPADLEARIAALPREQLRVYTPISHRAALEIPPYLAAMLERPGEVIVGAAKASALAGLPS